VLGAIAITLNGDKVATASEKGINIRIFNSLTGDLLQEVRRGNEFGMIYSLNFSRGGNWLCCTSDSDVVHVFASIPNPESVNSELFRGKKDMNQG
jgi:WD40 repeat protein